MSRGGGGMSRGSGGASRGSDGGASRGSGGGASRGSGGGVRKGSGGGVSRGSGDTSSGSGGGASRGSGGGASRGRAAARALEAAGLVGVAAGLVGELPLSLPSLFVLGFRVAASLLDHHKKANTPHLPPNKGPTPPLTTDKAHS
jgi:hypothetical protein